ncbi:MAG: aminotransferase class V-fold PLP-dependent enzyme [Gammaproteobacteria bacterium]|nr:aminotransferase class V-fold PLP-dependent enzyme [Gammaproteobacteria bacterium]
MRDDLIYLDYAATTPLDPQVAELMSAMLKNDTSFANSSAVHIAGRRASVIVEQAAAQLARLLNCAPAELIWTSGATESNNLAITGAARYRTHRGKHLITMPTEHKAVADVFRALETQGFDVTWLSPDESGSLDLQDLDAAFRDDTTLVSIMYVNNETGVLQDIAAIGERCRNRDVLFHVDAAQGVGKLPFDLASLPVDLASMTAHKVYGPTGIGALYIADRPRCHVEPLYYGGGQQHGVRPGTLPVTLIAAFGLAAEIATSSMATDFEHVQALRERLWAGLQPIAGVVRNGDAENSYPGILNVSIDDIEGESLLLALEPLCVATGSACNSQNQEPSYVLRALGRDDALAQSAVRVSFGRMSTESEIDFAVERYRESVERLRAIAPGRAASAT